MLLTQIDSYPNGMFDISNFDSNLERTVDRATSNIPMLTFLTPVPPKSHQCCIPQATD